ncbi:hypothetical protein ACJX0J_014221, partial [Zea mays]
AGWMNLIYGFTTYHATSCLSAAGLFSLSERFGVQQIMGIKYVDGVSVGNAHFFSTWYEDNKSIFLCIVLNYSTLFMHVSSQTSVDYSPYVYSFGYLFAEKNNIMFFLANVQDNANSEFQPEHIINKIITRYMNVIYIDFFDVQDLSIRPIGFSLLGKKQQDIEGMTEY